MRLDGRPDRAARGRGRHGTGLGPCLECGGPRARRGARFCGAGCRRAWNNRRAVRGAELYDLFMATRFERARAAELKLWRLLNRLAAGFHDEDQQRRAGRRSWRTPAEVLDARPYLLAEVFKPPARRKKSARLG